MQTLPARFAVRAARIKMKIVVLDGDVINPGDISWAPLEKLGEVAIYGDTPEDLIVERAAGAEVLVTNKVPLRSGTLSRLPDLRMVAVLATGYDIIDTADAAAHGIPVCNVVAYGVDDVAQHAWALLLELCRRTGEHTASVCAGEWKDTWCYWKTTPVCLRGRTLGVIGFGSIGRRVGELGHAFGMSVLANCRTPRNPPSYSPFAFASTDQIFQQADVISLHCPLTDATRAIINAKALARMKPGAILINTARGPLLDEAAVAEARKDLLCKGISLFAERAQVLGELLIHAPPDAVPEVGVRLFKEGKVRLPPQEEVVLVLPAPPGGLAVEDAVRFLRRPAGNPGQESLAPGAWAAHDGVEETGIEKAVDVLAPFASDVGVVLQAHAVRDGGGDGEAGVRQDLHEDPAAVGDTVEDIDLSAIVLHKMIPQALGLVHGGAELRLRLVGVEAVVGRQHHMVGFAISSATGSAPR